MVTQHSHTIQNTWTIQKMKLTWFWVWTIHMFQTWSLCELHPIESSLHMLKDLVSRACSLKPHMFALVNISMIKKQKHLSQGLTQSTNMKLWKNIYELKVSPTTLCIFKMKYGWIIDYIHLHLLYILIHQVQANNIMPNIILLDVSFFLWTSH
jgi:hypothetical protein